jgi:hypothetical protein
MVFSPTVLFREFDPRNTKRHSPAGSTVCGAVPLENRSVSAIAVILLTFF